MNRIKGLLTAWIITLIGFISKTYAVTAWTLKHTKDSASHNWSQIVGSRSILDMIKLVNSYLWFWIGFVCFVFMIWNWYKLISSNWDEKVMKEAKTALKWSMVWLALCLLAYIIVNVAVKLFAK